MIPHSTFLRGCGLALLIAGVLIIVVNGAITPMVPHGAGLASTAVSTMFLLRQSVAAVAALLLVLGSVGLYLRQDDVLGPAGRAAFAAAFAGSIMLFSVEWAQLFEVRYLAMRAPEVLNRLDAEGLGLDDIGAMIALAVLVAGWIGAAAATARAGRFSRRACYLVVAGFFATPFLSALVPPLLAAALGNGVLGTGWIWLGREVMAGPSHRAAASRNINSPNAAANRA